MYITASQAKIKIGDKLYTFLQKDEDSKIKFHLDNDDINLVTKEEVLDNIEDATYKDTFKAWYHVNGTLIQLAFKEEVVVPNTYELIFNKQEGFETTDNLTRDTYFTTAKVLNVAKSLRYIEYNKWNTDLIYSNKEILNINEENVAFGEVEVERVYHNINFEAKDGFTTNKAKIGVTNVGGELLSVEPAIEKYIIDYAVENGFVTNNTKTGEKDTHGELLSVEHTIEKYIID